VNGRRLIGVDDQLGLGIAATFPMKHSPPALLLSADCLSSVLSVSVSGSGLEGHGPSMGE
jgi:hypothetical protein